MRLAVGEPLPPSAARTGPAILDHRRSRKILISIAILQRSLDMKLVFRPWRHIRCRRFRLHSACARPDRRPAPATDPGYPDQPSRPRLRGGAVLQHRFRHRSRRQQVARRHPARRAATGQFQSALQGPIAGARHGLFARSSHARRRVDRLEFRHLHRYGDQCRQARHLCRPLAARGVLHARRQGSLGHGARRELRLRSRRRDLRGEDAGSSRPTGRA